MAVDLTRDVMMDLSVDSQSVNYLTMDEELRNAPEASVRLETGSVE